MARVAFELRIFGPIGAAGLIRKLQQRLAKLHGLPRRPFAHFIPLVAAFGFTWFTGLVPVAGHRCGEGIEFEVEVGVSCGDHLVIDEFVLAAEMAGEAFIGAQSNVSQVGHAGLYGLLVRPIAFGVRAEPCGGGSVAALAAHTLAEIERAGAVGSGHIQSVAGEAFRRFLGFPDVQNRGHALADHSGERLIGLRVLVAHDPNAVFVLLDAIVGARGDAAVAAG